MRPLRVAAAAALGRRGGLGRIALTNWAWTWLEEVERLLRVKPMIYSGPYRWSTVMADTTEFADAGYRL